MNVRFLRQHESGKELKLHLLIPATSPNPNFCRTTLSAALLDYPTPIIINWEGNEQANNPYASHLAKIDGILNYLRGLPSRNDEDLVLIVDGYDVWFQLRPEVLIERYQKTVKKRNEKLTTDFDPQVLAQHNLQQTVILGSDKKCWPQDMKYAACYAIPESPLPKDLFGSETDKVGKHTVARPRWLNSGTILGPISEVKAIFEATKQRTVDHFNGFSDQWYMAEVFGHQEYQRNLLSKHPMQNPEAEHITPEINENERTEYHMALDYETTLFHTNSFAGKDTAWITFGSNEQDDKFKESNYVKFHGGSVPQLPSDIANSRPPIAKGLVDDNLFPKKKGVQELPYNTTWADVPLLVNMVTGSVPVIIHLNGRKEKLDEWWPELWWHKFGWGKHLLLSGSRAGAGPLGTTTNEDTGETITWWKGAYNSRRGENSGYWASNGEWLYYNEICEPLREILFEGKPAGTPEKEVNDWMGPKKSPETSDTDTGKSEGQTSQESETHEESPGAAPADTPSEAPSDTGNSQQI